MPGLSESLKSETRLLHVQAERSAFMRVLLRGEMDRPCYCALLRNLHAIYAVLEPALRRHAADPALAPLVFPALWREAPLARDLDALHGPEWRGAIALQPATVRYVERVHEIDRAQPERLVAHSYVRYLGDLTGGQMLRRIVRDSLGLPAGTGTAFYDFGDAVETARLKQVFRAGLDVLAVDEATGQSIVAEARLAFQLHRQLFAELAGSLFAPP